MARLLIPAMCYHCHGVKVIYRSVKGDHRRSEFRTLEFLQALASNLVTEQQCPVCAGRGTNDVLVRD